MENQVHPFGSSVDKIMYNCKVNCGADSNRTSPSEATFPIFWINFEFLTIGRNFNTMYIIGDNAKRNGYSNILQQIIDGALLVLNKPIPINHVPCLLRLIPTTPVPIPRITRNMPNTNNSALL